MIRFEITNTDPLVVKDVSNGRLVSVASDGLQGFMCSTRKGQHFIRTKMIPRSMAEWLPLHFEAIAEKFRHDDVWKTIHLSRNLAKEAFYRHYYGPAPIRPSTSKKA